MIKHVEIAFRQLTERLDKHFFFSEVGLDCFSRGF